jgi:hypothetical protein
MTTVPGGKGQKALAPKAEVGAESCLASPVSSLVRFSNRGWHILSLITCERVTVGESGYIG